MSMNIRYKMRPRCNPQNDYLEINSDLKYNQYGEAVVGNVFNTDGTIKIEIYLSDYLINKTNHRFMYFLCLADLFAVYARGKDEFIRALKWGRAGVKNLPPSFNTNLAIREYNNRIRYRNQMNKKINHQDIFIWYYRIRMKY